ncbi:MAG: hypothetical protein ABIL52_08610 [candidate division WOR-3 bacterium]
MRVKASVIGETSTAYLVRISDKEVWISKNGVKSIENNEIEVNETIYNILKAQGLIKEEKKKEGQK